MPRRLLPFFLLATVFLAACDTNDANDDEPRTVQLSLSGVEPLTNGFHYEGWAIIDGAAVSTGKFNVDAQGALIDLDGRAVAGGAFEVAADLSRAAAVVITIEPDGDRDTAPAATKYLGGDVQGGSASLAAAHGSSLGDDFAGAAGRYILATPTNGPDSDETSGLWFLDPSSGAPQAALNLPTLPAGWAYEGWAVIDGVPVTTGRFTSVTGADDAAPFSGPNPGPPFPGEDFLGNAPSGLAFPVDLSEGTAVISVEPSPDNDPAPFTLKPLAAPIPANAQPGTVYTLNNNAASFPTGTARIR